MFSSGPGGAWSQEASCARATVIVGGRTAFDAVRPSKEYLALRIRSVKLGRDRSGSSVVSGSKLTLDVFL